MAISKLLKTLRTLDQSIYLIEGLGSYKATPNLDIKSRGLNHTTILLTLLYISSARLDTLINYRRYGKANYKALIR